MKSDQRSEVSDQQGSRQFMNRKIFCLALCALFFALCVSAQAQQLTKFPRIGYLAGGSSSANSYSRQAFHQGLRALGYAEGKNILIEYRYGDGNSERLPGFG